jgi:hypothetical protein
VKKRPVRFDRIEARCKQPGDPLIKFGRIVDLVVASVPSLTLEVVRQQFLDTVERGDFPVLGTGFRREPDRRAVKDLIDLYSLNDALPFAPGQYPLRPSLPTLKAAPLEMRACFLSPVMQAPDNEGSPHISACTYDASSRSAEYGILRSLLCRMNCARADVRVRRKIGGNAYSVIAETAGLQDTPRRAISANAMPIGTNSR